MRAWFVVLPPTVQIRNRPGVPGETIGGAGDPVGSAAAGDVLSGDPAAQVRLTAWAGTDARTVQYWVPVAFGQVRGWTMLAEQMPGEPTPRLYLRPTAAPATVEQAAPLAATAAPPMLARPFSRLSPFSRARLR